MNLPDGGTDLLSLSQRSQNRKSSDNAYGCGSFLFWHRSDAQVALQQSPILQNDMDKIIEMSYNGKRELKTLRPFTQLDEQTQKFT
jgi:hypothetical protein